MPNLYSYGRKREKLVVQDLLSCKAHVKLSPGSKGPADVSAEFPTGTRWQVQVKSTAKGEARWPCGEELRRLKIKSTKTQSTAVVAQVSKNDITYRSARDGRKLALPTKRK